ncbi:MAG: YggS family pyridoxal phosphate-dependent enzyme [Tidjanibacter sp.]|nr:YggS family pyridoxal phosphate-dependent enzyme [Tidjanibacter sp.]
MSIQTQITELHSTLPEGVTLVAVSKMQPIESLREAYEAGQRIFGESRPQEMCAKREQMPEDCRWHMIGHLQTNKVKYIAPFVEMIHSVDSLRLLDSINREAMKCGRRIDILLEVHLATEESKSGFSVEELREVIATEDIKDLAYIRVRGLMTIASNTDDEAVVAGEFKQLKSLFDELKQEFGEHFDTLSMGMTSDYPLAIECGSTMVRIGSQIFGERNY